MIAGTRRLLAFGAGLAGAILHPGRISFLVLFVTDRCNAQCPYCFNNFLPHLSHSTRRDAAPLLSLDEYERIAGNLDPLFQVVLSGGEPFLRDDVDAIVGAFHKRAGARLFSIPTNGSLPDRAARKLETMAASCPRATFNLIVSLDALGPRHDALRRLPGGFEKALSLCRAALELRRSRGNVNLVVTTAVSNDNLDEVGALQSFLARALPPKGWHHNIQYDQRLGSRPANASRFKAKALELETNPAGAPGGLWERFVSRWYVRRINAIILDQLAQDRMIYRCVGGRKIGVVMPDGGAYPCEPFVFETDYRRFPRRNLRDFGYDFERLRREPGYVRMMEFIEQGRCRACPWSCAATASMSYEWRNWPLWLRGTASAS